MLSVLLHKPNILNLKASLRPHPLTWFRRAIAWDKHLNRPSNSNVWAPRIRHYHNEAWLRDRRLSFSASSSTFGRTDTRALHGRVQPRWESSIGWAETSLPGTWLSPIGGPEGVHSMVALRLPFGREVARSPWRDECGLVYRMLAGFWPKCLNTDPLY